MQSKNILVIVTDQLTWRALPSYGNDYAFTPNIDRIAAGGARMESCYTPCPLCQPARAAFWSGKYPHDVDVLSNGRKWPVSQIPENLPTLGSTFAAAGYETVHFGKRHDANALHGFYCEPENEIPVEPQSDAFPMNFDTFHDRYTTVKAVEYLEKRKSEKPFLMVADFVNPHNICGWVGANRFEHEDVKTGMPLPPLPPNFEVEDFENRPLPIQYVCCTNNRQAQTSGWTKENFRHYLQAYYHYLSMADQEIGHVLDALQESGEMENTILVFLSDHGDSMTGGGRVTKQVSFYEEVAHVPMIFKGPGIKPRKDPIKGVSSLLDLFPTLCSLAGIKAPQGLRGKDISKVLTGQQEKIQTQYVASEWHTEWGYTVSPGRMICTQRYKYTCYLEGGGEELYDLHKDPWEQTNLAYKEESQEILNEMRALLDNHLQKTNDSFKELSWHADACWRSHKLGYENHKGPAAPMADGCN